MSLVTISLNRLSLNCRIKQIQMLDEFQNVLPFFVYSILIRGSPLEAVNLH